MRRTFQTLFVVCCLAACAWPARAEETLVWRVKQKEFDADFTGNLPKTLRKIASVTGWKIYYEAGSAADISVKFKGASEHEALRDLLGNLNFAKDTTNGITRLLVFHTISGAATIPLPPEKAKDYLIPNELLIKLKRNSPISIEELAARFHAKILGRDDRLQLYRLQFPDQASADAALQALSGSDEIAAVGHNYQVDPPGPSSSEPGSAGPGGGAPNPAALLNPKTPAQGGLVVGLVDTSLQVQDGYGQYVLQPISVVGQTSSPTDQPTHATGMLETLVQGMGDSPSMVQPVVIYQDGEQTTTMELMEGIVAAVNSGANPINLSLGGTGDSDMLHSLIDAATQKGIVFVAASGNTPDGLPTYPAAYPEVLSVTALDPATGQLASYADDFQGVASSAPGTSYIPFGSQIWQLQGTSTATAFATGEITALYNQTHTPLSQIVPQWTQLHPAPPPIQAH